jgi:hypothetical protein
MKILRWEIGAEGGRSMVTRQGKIVCCRAGAGGLYKIFSVKFSHWAIKMLLNKIF